MSEANKAQTPAGRRDIRELSHFILDVSPYAQRQIGDIITSTTIGNQKIVKVTSRPTTKHNTPYFINSSLQLEYQNVGFEPLSAYTREEIRLEAQRLYAQICATDERRKRFNYAQERLANSSDTDSHIPLKFMSLNNSIKMETGMKKSTRRSQSVPSRNSTCIPRQSSRLYSKLHKGMLCPKCEQPISSSRLLDHFLNHHMTVNMVRIVELFESHSFVELLMPRRMPFRESQLLALYAFGGKQGRPDLSLISRQLTPPNKFQHGKHSKFRYHLPLLLYACRTSWSGIAGDSELDLAMINSRNGQDDLWVIWMMGPPISKPLFVTLTAYDRSMGKSISRILRVRNLKASLDCLEFMSKDFNYLYLRFQDVKALTENFKQELRIEVIVDEIFGKPRTSERRTNRRLAAEN